MPRLGFKSLQTTQYVEDKIDIAFSDANIFIRSGADQKELSVVKRPKRRQRQNL